MASPDDKFNTITPDDWKRALGIARRTPNAISAQIRQALGRSEVKPPTPATTITEPPKESKIPSYLVAPIDGRGEDSSEGWRKKQPKIDRTREFALVSARLRQAGIQVDVFEASFLQISLYAQYRWHLFELNERFGRAKESQQLDLRKQIVKTRERIEALKRVQGVAYNSRHIAVGLENVQQGTMKDLVSLLHEAGHALLKDHPELQEKVRSAVTLAVDDLKRENAVRTLRTKAAASNLDDPEELLVHVVAQRTAEAGIPDSRSFARSAVLWAKDVYFRTAIALQASLGAEVNPKLALGWFENALQRLIHGQRIAHETSKATPGDKMAQLLSEHERLRKAYEVATPREREKLLHASDESVRAFGGPDTTGVSLRVSAKEYVKGQVADVDLMNRALKHFEAIESTPQRIRTRANDRGLSR